MVRNRARRTTRFSRKSSRTERLAPTTAPSPFGTAIARCPRRTRAARERAPRGAPRGGALTRGARAAEDGGGGGDDARKHGRSVLSLRLTFPITPRRARHPVAPRDEEPLLEPPADDRLPQRVRDGVSRVGASPSRIRLGGDGDGLGVRRRVPRAPRHVRDTAVPRIGQVSDGCRTRVGLEGVVVQRARDVARRRRLVRAVSGVRERGFDPRGFLVDGTLELGGTPELCRDARVVSLGGGARARRGGLRPRVVLDALALAVELLALLVVLLLLLGELGEDLFGSRERYLHRSTPKRLARRRPRRGRPGRGDVEGPRRERGRLEERVELGVAGELPRARLWRWLFARGGLGLRGLGRRCFARQKPDVVEFIVVVVVGHRLEHRGGTSGGYRTLARPTCVAEI